jgi:hypothetical protein
MTWGVLNAAMLVGLLGATVPVIIHLLNRRRDPIIDWGAMQFLDLGRRARRRLRLTELLLMLARMSLLAVVALALARPYWGGGAGPTTTAIGGGPARDVVIVLDGSASMGRASGGATPRALAVRGARQIVSGLKPGDSVAVLVAGDRVRPIVDPPSFDMAKADAALAALAKAPGRGSSDLPAALVEAFRVLERTQNPVREVILLSDGQRAAWRPGEAGRWALVRDLHRRLPVPPRIWSVAFNAGAEPDAANGSVGPVSVSRGLVTPGLPLTASSELANAGPGPLTRTAELLIDGRPVPGSAQVIGPVPAGGRAPIAFKTSLPSAGSHLLTVRLAGGGDALADDDETSVAVEVAAALPVLLVDGEPGREPLSGETDFLRAALAPTGDDTPQVKATVVTPEAFKTATLQNQSVLVLANVERLDLDQAAAVSRFLDAGGGLLVAPGDRTDLAYWNGLAWMPAKLGERTGDFAARKVVAHPAPASFAGPVLPPFGQGDAPALGAAGLFAYRRLEPAAGASVSARLDTGEPWAVERPRGRGRVLLLAGPLDAEGGTLPVNPDFVPLVHEWAFHLAGGSEPRSVKPGEPLVFDLNPMPAGDVASLSVRTPGGDLAKAVVVRAAGMARARFEGTAEAGVYRLTLPDPPGGFAFATVESDNREADAAPLDPIESARLAEGWPLRFEPDLARLSAAMHAAVQGGRREVWRWLVLAALAGLCVEIYLTRRLVRGQGLTAG